MISYFELFKLKSCALFLKPPFKIASNILAHFINISKNTMGMNVRKFLYALKMDSKRHKGITKKLFPLKNQNRFCSYPMAIPFHEKL
jgi:hypothetical protein